MARRMEYEGPMKLGASMPKGAFIERSMGVYSPEQQARNLMEAASAARYP